MSDIIIRMRSLKKQMEGTLHAYEMCKDKDDIIHHMQSDIELLDYNIDRASEQLKNKE